MADISTSTAMPACIRATQALDAIHRARALGAGIHIALATSGEERVDRALAIIVNAIGDELADAEAALSSCRRVA